ncbi:hypothetical protein [Streptomyces sp. NPDC093094]|uniref:hypothetical protein n=1 Tax=Streptomyces sp. NPDC093094 TaxID=3366026 RepID=UPI0037F8008D
MSKDRPEAGCFERNVRTVEILVDSATAAPAAAAGEPWQHYDLGHGHRSCTFFEQCRRQPVFCRSSASDRAGQAPHRADTGVRTSPGGVTATAVLIGVVLPHRPRKHRGR